jgi:hypothetical protein
MLGKVRRKGLGTPFLEEDAKGPEGAACPVYTVRRVNNGALITFQAMAGDRMLGYIETFRESEALTAGMIRVVRRLKRCGVGTKLYEAAATWGCAKGLMLTSDRLRSAYSDGFWQKQVRKGRATCVKATPSGWRQTQPDPQLAVDGRSNCVHYKLKNCEVATDLSGSKKR